MTRTELKSKLSTLNVLFVDDESIVIDSLRDALTMLFNESHFASNGQEGLELFEKNHIDIIITDLSMPVMDGLSMMKNIKNISPDVKCIFISGHSEDAYLKESQALQTQYIIKPISSSKLYEALTLTYS